MVSTGPACLLKAALFTLGRKGSLFIAADPGSQDRSGFYSVLTGNDLLADLPDMLPAAQKKKI